ncbi:hypothetical protein JRQ81_007925 [Phrynocephalus forsythii]|uniref:Fe2OG dioxygenase domain-containing protein n=1 Tax=Phrynocephalus forsythii TaxID=171643 RepID=A0A9Q0XDD6_9SAUR|nr:hypothetical protein JRQ81_007925 [Phrynocephalus forsythii]
MPGPCAWHPLDAVCTCTEAAGVQPARGLEIQGGPERGEGAHPSFPQRLQPGGAEWLGEISWRTKRASFPLVAPKALPVCVYKKVANGPGKCTEAWPDSGRFWLPAASRWAVSLRPPALLTDAPSLGPRRYRDGRDHMGEHRDDEKELVPRSPIASVSFGAPRDFVFRHGASWGRSPSRRLEPVKLHLEHGSLLMMNFPTNRFWYHSLPTRQRVLAPRVNLTFRHVMALLPSQTGAEGGL